MQQTDPRLTIWRTLCAFICRADIVLFTLHLHNKRNF